MSSRILLITTGGTIASIPTAGGIQPSLSGSDLLDRLQDDLRQAGLDVSLELCDLFRIASYAITPDDQLRIAQRVRKAVTTDQFDGVVVSHGTDTVCDSAWLTHLALGPNPRPVAFTCAMRHAHEPGADGHRNLLDAVATVTHPDARGAGVMLVVNGEIHSAALAAKVHTSALAAFDSPGQSRLGDLFTGTPQFTRTWSVAQLPALKDVALAPVGLVPAWAGHGDTVVAALRAQGVAGLVFEGTGAGHIHPSATASLEHALSDGIPVVVVSRATGDTHQHYGGGPGAGQWLAQLPLLRGGSLGAARALSALSLGIGSAVELHPWWDSVARHQRKGGI